MFDGVNQAGRTFLFFFLPSFWSQSVSESSLSSSVVTTGTHRHSVFIRTVKIHQFTKEYAGLLGRWDKWIVDQASDVPSIIFFFHDLLQNLLQKAFQFILFIFNKMKSFEYSKSIKSLKILILGASDAWSTIHLSHRPSDPA